VHQHPERVDSCTNIPTRPPPRIHSELLQLAGEIASFAMRCEQQGPTAPGWQPDNGQAGLVECSRWLQLATGACYIATRLLRLLPRCPDVAARRRLAGGATLALDTGSAMLERLHPSRLPPSVIEGPLLEQLRTMLDTTLAAQLCTVEAALKATATLSEAAAAQLCPFLCPESMLACVRTALSALEEAAPQTGAAVGGGLYGKGSLLHTCTPALRSDARAPLQLSHSAPSPPCIYLLPTS
jgi:hypothetical protein